MSNVTSLDAHKTKLNAPDADQVYVDDDGVKWFKFGVDYTDQRARTMSFPIWATSLEDAQERLSLIKDNSRIYGQIICDNINLHD
jgi:hypothetical protein